jgi:hypothetical protein
MRMAAGENFYDFPYGFCVVLSRWAALKAYRVEGSAPDISGEQF